MDPVTAAGIAAAIVGSVATVALSAVAWSIKRSVVDNQRYREKQEEESRLAQQELDREQSAQIGSHGERINTVEKQIEMLEAMKVSEAQTRAIVSKMVEPLIDYQKETSHKMDRIIEEIHDLNINMAKIDLVDRRSRHEDIN